MKPAMLPTAALTPNRANVREDLGDLTELAASMREHGVLQPIVVHEASPTSWTIVDGHRRHAAARLAGRPQVPCLIAPAGDRDQTLTVMLAAALHKRLEPLEQAGAFQALRNRGLTVADIARRTGYSTSTISARLLLLTLPKEAQDMVQTGTLTARDAQQLAREVKTRGAGTVRANADRNRWFTDHHRLQYQAATSCSHDETRHLMAGACGQCWEQTIRAHERGEIDSTVPRSHEVDEVAVQRRIDGDSTVPINARETDEAVVRLVALGLSDQQIAVRLSITARTVLRARQRTNTAPAIPNSRDGAA